MADDMAALDAEFVEQGARVGGQLLQAEVVVLGFFGFAKADLVDRDHAIAGLAQGRDLLFPGCRAVVLAMQQQDALAIGAARGADVHIGHRQLLALALKLETLDLVRILEALELGIVFGRRGGQGQRAGSGKNETGESAEHGGTAMEWSRQISSAGAQVSGTHQGGRSIQRHCSQVLTSSIPPRQCKLGPCTESFLVVSLGRVCLGMPVFFAGQCRQSFARHAPMNSKPGPAAFDCEHGAWFAPQAGGW